jgi:hypothetical protein
MGLASRGCTLRQRCGHPRGVYLLLSCRGSVVICLHRRDFIYIYIYTWKNSDYLIPLLHRLDFTCFCIESDLWMYGRIRHCGDFPLLALGDFRVVLGAIFWRFSFVA